MLMTPGERRLLALLVLFLAAGQLITWLRHGGVLPEPDALRGGFPGETVEAWAAESVAAEQPRPRPASLFTAGYLDLNRADSLALVALPGIGPALAGRILALRRTRGRFASVSELRDVRGIGPQRQAELESLVRVVGAEDSAAAGR
ncbi:MAG: helix-hairpin-helix domain-containing protein [Candidatus Eisenbacteria sp.]|nr:helix-hairpin-helix domain-containing protein [Candidatus Eisenbacteria bacterium]